jgi:FHA domain
VATCPSGHESTADDFCDVCGVLIGAVPTLGPNEAPPPDGAGAPAPAGLAEPCPRCGVARSGQFCESCGYDFSAGPDTFDPLVYRSAPPLPGPYPPRVPESLAVPAPAPPPASRPAQPVAEPVTVQPAPAPSSPAPSSPVQPPPPPQPASAGAAWAAVVTADRAYYDSVQAAGGRDAAGIAFPAYSPQRRFPLAGTEVRIGRHSASSGISPEIDLSVAPADPGVSRLHAVLLRAQDGTWSVVDPGSANGTVVNGSEIPPGQPVPLRDGDRIHLGAWTELRVIRET